VVWVALHTPWLRHLRHLRLLQLLHIVAANAANAARPASNTASNNEICESRFASINIAKQRQGLQATQG
jgi:hypothetical protein